MTLPIADLSPLAFDHESDVGKRTPGLVVPAESPENLVPGARCVPDTKFFHGVPVETASGDVLPRALVSSQRLCIEPGNASHHVIRRFIGSTWAARVARSLMRYIKPETG